MRRKYILAVMILVATGLIFQALRFYSGRPDASMLLTLAAEHRHDLCYSGTVRTNIDYGGRTISAMTRVSHSADGERIEYVSEPLSGMVVVTHDGEVQTYRPELNRTLVSRSAAATATKQKTALLLRNYRARIIGQEKIAGRDTYAVAVTPKRRGNPSKTIWIDKGTYQVLASVDTSANGTMRSQMRFEQVEYLPHLSEETFLLPAAARVEIEAPRSLETLRREMGFAVTQPDYIPEGYELDGYRLYNCECDCGHRSALIRYSDGLNGISIFMQPKDDPCGSGHCGIHEQKSEGSCEVSDCRQVKLGAARVGDKTVVVVADLPKEEIERIANSIK